VDDVINILLVDDEQRNLDALEAILAEPSYHLLRAEDADKALKLLLEHDVAAIVLDIKMPGVSGFELAQLIKGTKKFRQIPIVFLTAYLVDDSDVLAGYGAGAVDYLTKPVNPKILRHKIGVFADLFRKTRALAELNEHLEARVQQRTAELEASETALRAANQQKDAFLATLAHELRNPLAPLRTGLDILVGMKSTDPGINRALGVMNRQLDHMVRLIDDLLDVSRISRGMLELKKERVDLATIIDTAIDAARPYLDQRKQKIVVHSAGPVMAMIDATRVCQIVGNLLNNASKFTPAGGEIVIELGLEAENATIRVIDRGAGIPPDQIPRVFGMFTKIDRTMPHSKASGGLGIGLALARQLAELHGGTLTASSPGEGQGATFTMAMPTATTRPPPQPVEASAEPTTNGHAKLNIVVVEDNDDAADMLQMWLENMGHTVHVARTGPEGVRVVLDVKPDIVLCDIGLPEMDGVEVCKNVKAQMDSPPVMVALTGWGMESDRQRTREAGFEQHLVKPVALDKLRAVLETSSRPA
jgi:signal transduction histidine kinase